MADTEARRHQGHQPPAPGTVEEELGVPIPGVVLPPERWSQTALKRWPSEGPVDWSELFGRKAPVVVDLGCGNGRYLLGSALARPEMDHIGIDTLPVVIRYARRRGNQRGLRNLKFVVGGALEFLRDRVLPGSVREIHCYHPQPYADCRSAWRRLIRPDFLVLVCRALEPGGLFVVQTDHPDYWRYMRQIVPMFFDFREHGGPWPDAPEGRTRREIIARRQGLAIFRGYGYARTDIQLTEARRAAERIPMPRFRMGRNYREVDRLERNVGDG